MIILPEGAVPMTRIKICGLSREEDIACVNMALPDYAGFIVNYPKSKRNITPSRLRLLSSMLDKRIVAVGVFVDEDEALVGQLLNERIIGAAQLHGSEDEDYIRRLRGLVPKGAVLIKAFKIKSKEDILAAGKSSADMVLLDGGAGDGKVFDWTLPKMMDRPYFLAGGLNEENIRQAREALHPWGMDVSSGVETDGRKDGDKICRIVDILRKNR